MLDRLREAGRRVDRRVGDESSLEDNGGGHATAGEVRRRLVGRPREVRAGETVRWSVTVENHGDAPFRQLHAWTASEKNFLLDRREFVFGTVPPGEKRTWSVPIKIPKSFDSRRDEVTLHFEGAGGKGPADVKTTFNVVELPKPIFAFSLQVDDAKSGNGDGLPQRGEAFTVRIDVKNEGPGASGEKTYVSLKNLGDEKAFIVKGREVIGALAPGESKTASLEIDLRKGSKAETLPLRIAIVDEKSDEWTQEKVEFPIAADSAAVTRAKGAIRVEAGEADGRDRSLGAVGFHPHQEARLRDRGGRVRGERQLPGDAARLGLPRRAYLLAGPGSTRGLGRRLGRRREPERHPHQGAHRLAPGRRRAPAAPRDGARHLVGDLHVPFQAQAFHRGHGLDRSRRAVRLHPELERGAPGHGRGRGRRGDANAARHAARLDLPRWAREPALPRPCRRTARREQGACEGGRMPGPLHGEDH